jgi:hypothetical protein
MEPIAISGITLARRAEMLADYQRLRKAGIRLNMKLANALDRDTLHDAGRRLGILRNGTLCFDTEDTVAVFMDYALRHIRPGGMNAFERCLAESPPADPEELRWLRASAQGRYGLLRVKQVVAGFGIEVEELFRRERLLLIDINLSQTAAPGAIFAAHAYSPGDYWMSSGAGLPVPPDTLVKIARQVERQLRRTPGDGRPLSPEQDTQLATLSIRVCLEDGMSERTRYEDPHPERQAGAARPPRLDGPHPLAAPRTRIGRNDPCPCGSGRKFKNCCRH